MNEQRKLKYKEIVKKNELVKVKTLAEHRMETGVRRDLALLLDEDVEFSRLNSIAKQTETNLLKSVNLFDVYEGDNIPKNQKSIAISVTIQSTEKTLNDNDLENINKLIIETVENKTGAKIRS